MSAAKRRRRHEEHEEHQNHERWLVTYADMLTLLMVLFIVMFAMSQVDNEKYQALKTGLASGFGATPSITEGSDSILDKQNGAISPDMASEVARVTFDAKQDVTRALTGASEAEQDLAAAERVYSKLERIRRQVEAALARKGLGDDVRTAIDDRGLVVSLVSKHVVFKPDVANLSPRGQRVVDTLAPVLRDIHEQLRVDGHTNQVKVHPRYFATDWDLSAARAVTVLRRLNEVNGVPARRLSVTAFGHEKPLIDPSIPGSQDVNKRVDIVILPDADSKTQELLGEVAAAQIRPASMTTTHEEG
ncbi:OmpA family protein [Nocardioides sp. MAH-18]|uniref:OmpA family protein n=1 Tax=Nocardioides agri TaxID=2682843 RepID=A0A6L6XTB1_9ACTN|nr:MULTISPECIES: flagellar motor protein MotB [unclassified Nocardioides]MBA2955771.1 flagellar motor protein MotB [Nocardioides sp. CGMCC 1.13656]MVQ50621.1 OmpA family protein [Nocardioides sp. MAH-18]